MAERAQAARPLVDDADDALNRRIHLMNVLTALQLHLAGHDGLPLPFAADSLHTEADLKRSYGKGSNGNQTENGREERNRGNNQESEFESAARRRVGSEIVEIDRDGVRREAEAGDAGEPEYDGELN